MKYCDGTVDSVDFPITQSKLFILTPISRLAKKGADIMSNCDSCKFRARYDKNPRSILGRLWKWHIGWCPGWRSYLKSLPPDKKESVLQKYK